VRIAALYDIHGNLPALEAALHAARKSGADKVVLGGDIAAGPLPAETLEILMAFGDWVSAIQGAADRAVVTCYDLLMSKHKPEPGSFDDLVLWAAGHITGHQRDYLRALPQELRFLSQDLGEIYFFHALAGEGGEPHAQPPGAQVVVAGRDHRQALEQRDGRQIVRPGSVGMPQGDLPGAYWALLGEKVELIRTEYDTAHAARRIQRSGMPGAKDWCRRYVTQ
jgi:predicted phosphodiesterase